MVSQSVGAAEEEYDLFDVRLDEISFVPRGANGEEYLLVKEAKMKEAILKSIAETPDGDLKKALSEANLDEESVDVLETVGRVLKTYKDKLPAESLDILRKACGYPEPKPQEGKGKGDDDEEGDEGEGSYGYSKEQLEKMDPGVRVLFEKMAADNQATRERAEKAEALAKSLKDAEITKDYIAKAEGLPNIPGLTAEKHAPIMKILGEDHPAEFAELYSVLKAADNLLEKSAAWDEFGSHRAISGGSVMGKIQKAAEALVRKDTSGMTYEDAIEKVLDDHPEWYDEYEADRAEAVKGVA